MNRKKILWMLAGLVLVAGVSLLLTRPRELERWKAGARARGEKLTLDELAPAWSSNTPGYQHRFTSAVSRLQSMPVPPSMVEMMHTTSIARARLAWRQPAPTGMANADNTWSNLIAQMDGSAAALVEIHPLLRTWPRGLQWDPDGQPLSPFPNFVAVRRAAQFLAAAVVGELQRGQLDAALTNLHSLIALGQLSRDGGTLVEGMIGVAVAGLAHGACWEVLTAPGWDEPRLLALQRALQANDIIAAHVRTVELERAWVLAWIDHARTNRQAPNNANLDIGINSSHPLAKSVNANVFMPVWRMKWSYQDELRYLQRMQSVVETVRWLTNDYSGQSLGALLARQTNAMPVQTVIDAFRYPMNESAMASFSKASLVVMRTETRRQMLLTVLALQRWRMRHGTLPEQVTSLVPELLPALPRDGLGGGILRYRRESDGGFTLYSAGENGQDDGGAGDDVHWPRAVED